MKQTIFCCVLRAPGAKSLGCQDSLGEGDVYHGAMLSGLECSRNK